MNMVDDLFGFPCRVQDPIILEPAKNKRLEYDPIEEERRLFYVAVTRAEENVIIYTHEDMKSPFLDEIRKYISEMPMYENINSKKYENKYTSKGKMNDLTYR
jgi:DNA helicase-4